MNTDLLDLPLRVVLERLLAAAPPTEADRWVDVREQQEVAPRELLAAGKRGEVALFKTGRRTLVRRSELDRWIQLPEHAVVTQPREQAPEVRSAVAHILERNGFRKAGAR